MEVMIDILLILLIQYRENFSSVFLFFFLKILYCVKFSKKRDEMRIFHDIQIGY